jgi:tripartite-type tricarboxylate transporter receptor subunit TctC
MQRRTVLAGLGASLFGGIGTAFAQGYPQGPVKMIVPYSAGGGIDAVARLRAVWPRVRERVNKFTLSRS